MQIGRLGFESVTIFPREAKLISFSGNFYIKTSRLSQNLGSFARFGAKL